MKLLSTLVISICLSCQLSGQYHTIEIPEIKNLNQSDLYPERSILATYVSNFDLLISLKNYSAWGPDDHIKILAHHKSGWYKIEMNTQRGFNPYTVCYSTIKINDAIGDTVFNILKDNHLFEMIDERSKKLPGFEPASDTSIISGKKQVTYTLCDISDGPEYEFELITDRKYKKLYFYAPQHRYKCYPKFSEMKVIINSINVFEKYLGN